jgi:hypothetical protein
MYHHGHCPWMIWDPERSGANKAMTSIGVTAPV